MRKLWQETNFYFVKDLPGKGFWEKLWKTSGDWSQRGKQLLYVRRNPSSGRGTWQEAERRLHVWKLPSLWTMTEAKRVGKERTKVHLKLETESIRTLLPVFTSIHRSKNLRHWCNLVLRNQLSGLILSESVPPWISYLREEHEVIKNGQPGWA